MKTKPAERLKIGDWITYDNSRYNERVVGIETTRDELIKVSLDYGHGGEPATRWYRPEEVVVVS